MARFLQPLLREQRGRLLCPTVGRPGQYQLFQVSRLGHFPMPGRRPSDSGNRSGKSEWLFVRRASSRSMSRQECLDFRGAPRWKVLQADHKVSGLHAGLVCHMLAHKDLPAAVRAVLRQYVLDKARGRYGHSLLRRRRFAAHFWNVSDLAAELLKQEPESSAGRCD
jgi:hypothetical protein